MIAEPSTMMIIALALVLLCGLLVGLGGPVLLRRLPEPQPPEDADADTIAEYRSKISYRRLATVRFAVISAACAAAGMTVAVVSQPAAYWPCWVIISVFGVLLAGIDAATTWLPIQLTYAGWLGMITATVITLLLGPPDGVRVMITIVGGAMITGVGYFLLWRFTGGRGVAFGDVRLMPIIGAVGGTMGWSGIYWTVLLGSVVGAVIGLARLLLRRRGPFPYAPALVAGPYAAAVLLFLF
jgi:leader peptidase (prepilin peptidase) / N-methyltransferase